MDAQAQDSEPTATEMNDLLLRVMRGVNGQAFRLFGNKVLTGPFAGSIIPARTPHWDDGNSGSKLLGTYEFELHGAIETALWREPEVIVNVGCAEGFYAIGMARLMRKGKVFALDICEESRHLCEDYAEQNRVQITVINGAYCPEELRFREAPGQRLLYIIDCEGEEVNLVNLERCPDLANSDIIVECHDFLKPGASRTLAERLYGTHRVERIRPRLPNLEQFQFIRQFPTVMSMLMAVEKRPMPCCWLACWANSRGDHNG